MAETEHHVCQICGEEKNPDELVPGDVVSEPVADIIRKAHPTWDPSLFICRTDLNNFRSYYFSDMLEREKGDLSSLERGVMLSLKEQELLSRNINLEFDRQLTFGERISDRLADFAGSWTFISIFTGMICIWIVINSIFLITHAFDPYPYILLNLVLSCIAAIQAPVIIMSQNRQEARDRLRAEHDYQVNLKAELEIRHLHEKMDHLILRHGQRLMEMQKIQLDLMEELVHNR